MSDTMVSDEIFVQMSLHETQAGVETSGDTTKERTTATRYRTAASPPDCRTAKAQA
jgi:hypothetical protein